MSLLTAPRRRKPGYRLALAGCVLAMVVVGLGAFTRLVDAGLGCPDWPGCYGHLLWPIQEHHVAAANEAWPDMPVEHDKTWPEMVHRYFASALGLLAIVLVGLALRHRPRPAQPLQLPVVLLAFVILQGMFGMWTVTLRLWPQVVTAHLLGGFTTFALLWLLALRLGNQRWLLADKPLVAVGRLRPWALLGLAVVIGQVFLGGWTTSNYAAVACPDFPTCQGAWVPTMDFAHGFNIFQQIGPNYLGGTMANEGRMAIHYSHRLGAIVTLVYILFLCVRLWRIAEPGSRRLAGVLALIMLLQLALGIGNVVLHFPLWIAVAHNLGGALLLLALVTLNHRVFTAQPR
ncbi:MAG: COX15/CtaA family protein [Spongiibacteraceae bacterium]|nr:COX15/CtaA family protein [Spongiibacteraceae bacterium]